MTTFDYAASAELFASSSISRRGKPRTMAYRRFRTAAEALRYAIEVLPAPLLNGTVLEVGEQRYDAAFIRALYDDPAYPLARWSGSTEPMDQKGPATSMPR
jgi:hypothetical protein